MLLILFSHVIHPHIKFDSLVNLKTKPNPLITVVTVCYNSASMIEKTLRSVVEQNYLNKEYVVIDGASTDGTQKIVDPFIDSIDYFVSEPDNGIYHAMNKAVGVAKGKWTIFMNAGDVFVDNDVLAKVCRELNDITDVVYGDILTMNNVELQIKEAPDKIIRIHRMPFCHQAVFTRTSLLKDYPFDEKYKLSADFKLYKQLSLGTSVFRRLPIPITIYDRTGLSNSQRARGLAENIAVIKEIDNWQNKLRLLPRLYFVKGWATIRQFLKNKKI